MTSVNLSKRLQTIVDMVPKGSIVADVGSDHGKLMIALYEQNIIDRGYAIENKKGPFNRLVNALDSALLIDHIVPLFSSGIEDLPSCVDTVVIAGMGGNLIVDILKKDTNKLKNVTTLIIDAHSSLKKVRREITELGFNIFEEKIIKEDGVYYEIIKFVKSDKAIYSDSDFEFGPMLKYEKSLLFKEKYESRIKEIDLLLTNKSLPKERQIELNNEKNRIRGVL